MKDLNSAQPKKEQLFNNNESEKIYEIDYDVNNSQIDSVNNFKFGLQGSS